VSRRKYRTAENAISLLLVRGRQNSDGDDKCREETSQRNLTDGRKRDGLFVPFSMEKFWKSANSTPPILFPVFGELETFVLLTSRFTRVLGIK
jgi:hypothetical protein